MPSRSPRCPDCSSPKARSIVDGELGRRAQRGDVVSDGCVITDDNHAWDCPDCGRRFGNRERPYQKLQERSREDWVELVKTMLPQPVQTNDAGELLGGDPAIVIVRVESDTIAILEAGIEWCGAHSPTTKGKPFAKLPFRTPASRVAEVMALAWSKRVSRYRWCPRCHRTVEPEHMQEAICHGCAERVMGVVF